LAHLDQAVALYDPDAHRPLATRFGQDNRVTASPFGLLATTYGWFTQGFDTLDSRETRALLDELAR